jgi:hypothetical protein
MILKADVMNTAPTTSDSPGRMETLTMRRLLRQCMSPFNSCGKMTIVTMFVRSSTQMAY